MVDELDKANASTNGDPFAALLPMLSSETNTTYPDAYLLGSVNLSYSSFIFTANSISKLGTPLLDRIDVFNVSPPSPKDYLAILRGMIAEAAQNTCINESETDDIMERLMGHGMDCLARGDSLRKVERAIKDAVAKYVWKPKSHLTLVK
jgi:ATP-dependent Lon protease